ncbi:MAG: hypothetical protein AAB364_00360 [Patescibacteria group bacterium]|mgnify:CR=1 FL=1
MSAARQSKKAIFSEQALARRQRERLWRSSLWLLLALALLADFIIFANHSRLLISQVQIAGQETVSQDILDQATQEFLAGDYLFVLPRRNALWYPRRALAQALLAQFPTLESAQISRENFTTIKIVVAERRGQYLWCGSDQPQICFLLDQSGLAFAPAPVFSGESFVRFTTSGPNLALNTRPFSVQNFTQITNLITTLNHTFSQTILSGLAISELVANSASDYRLTATRAADTLSRPLTVLANLEQVSSELNLTLQAALLAPDFVTEYQIAQKNKQELEYLDLRFPGKVFYKFAN